MKRSHVYWILGCVLGNFLQLYWISNQFFKYDVTTTVQVHIPEKIDSPSIIICIDYRFLLKWHTMDHQLKRQLLTSKGCEGIKNQNQTTIFSNITGDIDPKDLNETTIITELNKGHKSEHECLTSKLKTIKNSKVILDNTLHREDFIFFKPFDTDEKLNLTWNKSPSTNVLGTINSSILTSQEFVFAPKEKKCFKLNPQGKFGKHIDYISVRTSEFQRLYWNCLGFGALIPPRVVQSDGLIALCPSGRKCVWELMSKAKVKFDSRFSHLSYTEYRSKLLPPPYVTNCRNYSLDGLEGTRESCFLSCVKKVKKDMKDNKNDTTIIKTHAIVNRCSRKCHEKDCSTVIMLSKEVDKVVPDCGEEGFSISIFPSDTPVIQSDTAEQIALVQYLTDIGSSIGFWVGLSIVGITEKVLEFILTLIRKKGPGFRRDLETSTSQKEFSKRPPKVKIRQEEVIKMLSSRFNNPHRNLSRHPLSES